MGLIVLGAFLALIGGIITQIVMVKWGDIRTRKSLILLLTDLITQINAIIEELNNGYMKTGMALLAHIFNINNNLAVFGRNREFVIKLSQAKLRKDIIDYFDRVSISNMALQGFESMRHQPSQKDIVATGIKNEIGILLDLKTAGERIKDDLNNKR